MAYRRRADGHADALFEGDAVTRSARPQRTAAAALLTLLSVAACTPTGDVGSPSTAALPAQESAPPSETASAPAVEPAAPTGPVTRFGDPEADAAVGRADLDGIWVVAGVDVAPGIYRTVDVQVPDGMNGGILFDKSCMFGQYSDADGGLDALIAGGTADGGRPTVTLSTGQLFRTQRCGAWQLVDEADLFDAPAAAPDTISDGMWLVGEDLRPGTYRTEAEFTGEYVEGAFCGYEVDSTWTDWDAEMLLVAFAGPGPGEVTLETGQQFVSSECGTWRLQPAG